MARARFGYLGVAFLLISIAYFTFFFAPTQSADISPDRARPDFRPPRPINPIPNPPKEDEANEKGRPPPAPPKDSAKQPIPTYKPSMINVLMKDAEDTFDHVLAKQTHSLQEAAAAYRERRGRHPPPGFDRWYKYAVENNAVMVEDFWDQVYHDLNPFWALEPAYIRALSRKLGMGVEIKDGKVAKAADWFWHEIWGRMIGTVAEHLPDMFVAMNPMDESRLLVRWENMTDFMTKTLKEKKLVEPEKAVRDIKGWNFDDKEPEMELPNENWNGYNPYAYARRACAPDSPARQVGGILSPLEVLAHNKQQKPKIDVWHYFDGSFVSNYTQASDFCYDATIGGLHGALMLPLTTQNSDVLMPMFGGSKFHVNNEILLPAPMYWNGEERFGGEGGGDFTEWAQKADKALWRGTATGGRNKPFNWYMFHRHRFVAMTNGTRYENADESGYDLIFNEFLRQSAIKPLSPSLKEHFGDWLKATHDVGFTNLVCDENEPDGGCWYTNDEFEMIPGVQFAEQFANKFLPDIDGNSFSGRYRGFILSNSLPIKATIYREWHDSRLMAWKHFVPMNNRFSDYYSIMEYFMGDVARGIAGRDDHAEKIAVEGRKWGEKVLRKVDMQIYVFRLLLEYGRITDERRLDIGWVDDLVKDGVKDEVKEEVKDKVKESGT